MTNVTEETVTLARQLWALHQEALGGYDVSLWDEELTAIEREAWVQVAQHVETRLKAVVDVSLDLGRMMGIPDHK